MDKETIDTIVNIGRDLLSIAAVSAVVHNFVLIKLMGGLYDGKENFLTRCSYKFSVNDKTKTTYEEYIRSHKGDRSLFPL